MLGRQRTRQPFDLGDHRSRVDRGRPERRRSASPCIPSAANRDRHLRTVSTVTRSRRAISAFAVPTEAANTIFARSTSRTEEVGAAATLVNVFHSDTARATRNGEVIAMTTVIRPSGPRRGRTRRTARR